MEQKLLFILNPISGGKSKQDWEPVIREYFKDSPHRIEFFLLSGKKDDVSIKHYIQTINPDKVVAVGGDGTIKLVAEQVKETGHVMGILPAGSANGMAKELGLPLEQEDALSLIVNGQAKAVDALWVNNSELCLHLSDLGLNAMLVKYFDESPGRGMWGYGRSMFKMLWNKRAIHAEIKNGTDTIRRRAYMIVLANARMYGTGIIINPRGDLSDGKFELVVVQRLNFWAIVKVLLSHRNFPEEHIEIIDAQEVTIRSSRKVYFQVDGEYRGRMKEITASIMPQCLKIVLPDEVEHAPLS